jgi:formate hydrogenlyase subunit 4
MSSLWADLGLLTAALLISGVTLGWVESRFTKLRYFQVPRYLAMAAGIGILAFYLALPGGLG